MRMHEDCFHCFKNLSVETRFKIYFYLIAKKRACVSEVTNFIHLKQPTVSYHLNEMESSGLLKRDACGKHVYFSVNKICPNRGEKCLVSKNKCLI